MLQCHHGGGNKNYLLMGRKLRRARKRLHLTQEKLAEYVDLSPAFVGYIERGTRIPSVESLVKMCRVLRISLDWVTR